MAIQQVALPGILGGMGPHAMIEFESALIDLGSARGAHVDQEHLRWVSYNACTIPDRTRALAGDRSACLAGLIEGAQRLRAAGADFIVVPCNTAHAFRADVMAATGIPWLSLIEAGSDACKAHRRIAVFATLGTVRERMYERALTERGLTALVPDPDGPVQADVTFAIEDERDGIKATGTRVSAAALEALRRADAWAHAQNADAMLAGCTELSVGLHRIHDPLIAVVDPLRAYAEATFAAASSPASVAAG